MDFGGQEMDESGISIGFDFTDIDSQLLDINDLFPDELLQTAPQETEPINFYEITSRPAPVQSPSFKSESVSSRTQLKQQLMKDQLLKERERIKPKELPKSPAPRPVKVPVNIQNVVPQHVLQVKTGLQNPTKYHILEKQKNQVIQFLSSSQKEKANFGERREAYSAPLLQRSPAAVGRPAASFTIPPTSPGMLSVASNDNSDAEVIDSILSYEESSDAPRSLYGSNASLESSSRFKSEPESYEDVGKERVKKETHNMIERRRRYNINDRIMELKDLLPNRNEPHYDVVRDSRSNKGTILKSSVDYIKFLKEDVHKMKQIEVDNRNLQLENRKLLLRIQQLEIKAQQKGIDLEEKTWKPASAEEILAGAVKSIRGPSLAHMPDVVTDAACRYDETMDDVPSPDPMLTAAAALPLPSRPHRPSPLSPMEIQ